MQNLTSQIPTLLGSFAAMLVAFLSLMNGTSPATCLYKAVTAFLVCAAFGLIVRHALETSELESSRREPGEGERTALESIVPGTSLDEVDQMLAGAELPSPSEMPEELDEILEDETRAA